MELNCLLAGAAAASAVAAAADTDTTSLKTAWTEGPEGSKEASLGGAKGGAVTPIGN